MQAKDKNFLKSEMTYYLFARDEVLYGQMQSEAAQKRLAELSAGTRDDVSSFGLSAELVNLRFGDNLIQAMSHGPDEGKTKLGAWTVDVANMPDNYDVAEAAKVSVIFATKDRQPFGDDVQVLLDFSRRYLESLADGVAAHRAEITIDGYSTYVYEPERTAVALCEATREERAERRADTVVNHLTGILNELFGEAEEGKE